MRMMPRKPGKFVAQDERFPSILPVSSVTENSIIKLKQRALMGRTMTRMDTESGRRRRPSWLSSTIYKLKQPFTRRYWVHLFERNDNETLVDSKLLSYAYLEAGLIETVSACVLIMYLTSRQSDDFDYTGSCRTLSCSRRMDSPLQIYVKRSSKAVRNPIRLHHVESSRHI
jgi:hypothetical protein